MQLLVLVLLLSNLILCKSELSDYLGTKSRYRFNGKVNEAKAPTGCHLKQVHLVARHGTRNPSSSDIKSFKKLETLLQNNTFSPPYAFLNHWKSPYNAKEYSQLHLIGKQELYQLAKRDLVRYKKLLNTTYNPVDFDFYSSSVSRTVISGSSYGISLFEGKGELTKARVSPFYVQTLQQETDSRLEIKKGCKYWGKEIEDNHMLKKELTKYEMKYFPKIQQQLNEELNVLFTFEEVVVLFKLCSFDYSLFNLEKQFCSIFKQKDLVILSYYFDLMDYYNYSYGNEINMYLAVDLIKFLLDQIQLDKVTTLSFTHSETILFFVSALSLFKDNITLTSDLNLDQIQQREFKTSDIAPFAGNIHIEVYQCKGDFELRFLLNEKVIQLPNCPVYCNLNQFKLIYEKLLSQNYTKICSI
ncbi:phosphoglycerate mutase-like protein [Neoconidiobolus thromboides FSU 785]|nr:phosphoglycerate mutase-like protein [Neoconidiobolus thromboides FSU 785]